MSTLCLYVILIAIGGLWVVDVLDLFDELEKDRKRKFFGKDKRAGDKKEEIGGAN